MLAGPCGRGALQNGKRHATQAPASLERMQSHGCRPWLRAAWALLATDSQQKPSIIGQSLRRRLVIADVLFPRSILSLIPIIPIAVCKGYFRRPPDSLCISNTVGRLPCAMYARMIAAYQPPTVRVSRFHYTARCAPSRSSSLRCGPPLPLLTALAPPAGWFVWLHAGAIHCPVAPNRSANTCQPQNQEFLATIAKRIDWGKLRAKAEIHSSRDSHLRSVNLAGAIQIELRTCRHE